MVDIVLSLGSSEKPVVAQNNVSVLVQDGNGVSTVEVPAFTLKTNSRQEAEALLWSVIQKFLDDLEAEKIWEKK